ncbi:MAG: 2-oxoacid:acceptor oxidoreductase family protein [Ruminococcus sp.]|jgi:pyruvate ferredoxin oxidoreductase gamma subunit|nr:2-oxoacid:acceptor oxidoreductase family protein [Ruminococcus sp.]MBQ1944396.1 2-oxoacid:acceptor oxidoreductase family protein [Ruminococcus sp.]MBQ4171456.1 2-oxoacid:acceptor oxidoreductase family protein [Ruminococcus sp.]MBQ5629127.1 2-oxoacid:acceptor oxidoreductase family protein [Ruminococcus sp.]MBQ5743621.1 2-oxoacid:acceptor oxidoreductase family protein [Ruminococcus sp.]
MTEILWHGRGGQGAFTAARLLGDAYSLKDNAYALAFPSFGPERRGAPIRAFTKLDKKPIGNRSEITRSNYSIFLDDTLFNEKSFRELKQNGIILLNTKKTFEDPRVITLDGDGIAARILGLPITNTILLGAFAAVSREITLEDINKAIRQTMPKRLHEKNIAAVKAAFEEVVA